MTYDKNNLILHEQHWPKVYCINLFDKNGQGMVMAYKKLNKSEYVISNLFVSPEARGNGMGNVLLQEIMDKCLDGADQVTITIWVDNNSEPWARDWYIRKGFKLMSHGFLDGSDYLSIEYKNHETQERQVS